MHLCSQRVRFCINRVSSLWLIITCAFVLIDGVFLHQQSVILFADHPLCICAHSGCVSASTVSFLPLIIPCAFVLTGSVYLHSQSHTTVADYPLHIAHRMCVLLIMLCYPHCPHHALSLFLLVGVWLSHMTRDHSINLAHLMCSQKVCITIIPHLFTGCIPQYTSRRYVASQILSLH